jgi:subtilisin family serine protease
MATLLLASCGGNPSDAKSDEGRIPGEGHETVRAAIRSVDTGDTYTAAEISVSSHGEEIIRTKLKIVFRPDATVSQANDLLAALDAGITTAVAGLETVVVRIPDPGNLENLDAIVDRIKAEPFVWFVSQSILPLTSDLPENITATHDVAIAIRNHVATGAASAWNARLAVRDFPRVIVVDYFGDGPPNDDLEYAYVGDDATDFGADDLHSHGYHVVGTISGAFGGGESGRGYVTGMMPETIRLSVIDLKKTDPLDSAIRLLLILQGIQGETAIVSTSLGWNCNTEVTCLDQDVVRVRGAWWNQAVRLLGLEDRFLHLTAAGNIEPPVTSVNQARYGWYPGAASLTPDLVDANGVPLAPLNNTLTIENVVALPDFPYAGPKCLNKGSFRGGHLGGIGTGVWSFTDAASKADYKTGTSMATPQVAGLAAYILSIRPELTPVQIAAILLDTAVQVPVIDDADCSDWATPADLIQAYAALLALDRPGLGWNEMPVRHAVLDVDSNGDFTEADIEAFVLAFETSGEAVDFGRADLNGDGRSGGVGALAFDLDLDGLRAARGVAADILGNRHVFDETALTDIAILCYYAYSSLFDGIDEARDNLLEPYRQLGQCGDPAEIDISVAFAQVVEPGVATPFQVVAVDAEGQPVEGLFVEIDVSGGTVSIGSGSTDSAGRFVTMATLSPGGDSITVTVTVRDAPGGEVIDVVTRSAVARGQGPKGVRLLRRGNGDFIVYVSFDNLTQNDNPPTIFYESDTHMPSGQQDFSDLTASLQVTGSGGFDDTSATAKAQGTRSEKLLFVGDGFGGFEFNVNFSLATTMTNPPRSAEGNAVSWAAASAVSCLDFEVEGEDVEYMLEVDGSTERNIHVNANLSNFGEGNYLELYSTSGAQHQFSGKGILAAGADYRICFAVVGKVMWESWRRTQLQTELEARLDARLTLAPAPPQNP